MTWGWVDQNLVQFLGRRVGENVVVIIMITEWESDIVQLALDQGYCKCHGKHTMLF